MKTIDIIEFLIKTWFAMVIMFIICCFIAIFTATQPSSSKFHVGDIVCIKLNGAKGVIYHESNRSYAIKYADHIGQIHEIGLLENEIIPYAEKE